LSPLPELWQRMMFLREDEYLEDIRAVIVSVVPKFAAPSAAVYDAKGRLSTGIRYCGTFGPGRFEREVGKARRRVWTGEGVPCALGSLEVWWKCTKSVSGWLRREIFGSCEMWGRRDIRPYSLHGRQ
jgi:hypothetical protein